ncbi:hypothetical protein CRUP_014598 [Coryphaenoides rupestris]|nr:hypothetical protein CRUP_014598 [Coryphaenoides rupestris]
MTALRDAKAGGAEVNRAVIVTVNKFRYGVELTRRPGTGRDTKRLHRILSKLGFQVTIEEENLDAEEIYKVFQEASRVPVRDCFLAVLSSHGEEGCVFGADGEPVRLARVFGYFDDPCMMDKTKLFFIQACRGGDLDGGVQVDSARSEPTDDPFSQSLSVPVDTAVIYATPPGYAAITGFGGAVFLQTLCTLLEEEGGRDLEITRLLTRLCHSVAYTFQARGGDLEGKKEMPCFPQFLVLVTSERGCDWVKAQCKLCSDWWWAAVEEEEEEVGGGADMGGRGKEREKTGGVLLLADTMVGVKVGGLGGRRLGDVGRVVPAGAPDEPSPWWGWSVWVGAGAAGEASAVVGVAGESSEEAGLAWDRTR